MSPATVTASSASFFRCNRTTIHMLTTTAHPASASHSATGAGSPPRCAITPRIDWFDGCESSAMRVDSKNVSVQYCNESSGSISQLTATVAAPVPTATTAARHFRRTR